MKLIPPTEVKSELAELTISVSDGKLAPVTGAASGTTDYGMIIARVSDGDMTETLTKYIMLIP